MITVYYEKYRNDFDRKEETATFPSLADTADWIFNQMRCNYTKDTNMMDFPTPEAAKRIGEDGPWEIEFMPERGGPTFWIHMMKEDGKIIFSDGRMTAGQKHWSKAVQEWCRACRERQKAPHFDFAE